MIFNNFIVLAGIDGSGKTTQAELLLRILKKNNYNCVYVWNRYEPFLMKPVIAVAKKIFLNNLNAFKDYKKYSEKKRSLYNNSLLMLLFQITLLLDYSILIIIRVLIPLLKRKVVICDRYIYDTLIDISAESGFDIKRIYNSYNLIIKLLPEPKYFIIIDIHEMIALKRKNDIPDILYLTLRRRMYKRLIKINQIKSKKEIIDGNRSIQKINRDILYVISNRRK